MLELYLYERILHSLLKIKHDGKQSCRYRFKFVQKTSPDYRCISQALVFELPSDTYTVYKVFYLQVSKLSNSDKLRVIEVVIF